jgi:hypothetical protein
MREALDSLKRPVAHGFSVLGCFVNATTSDPNSREEIGDGAGGIAPIPGVHPSDSCRSVAELVPRELLA